jgi:hypothetical protein
MIVLDQIPAGKITRLKALSSPEFPGVLPGLPFWTSDLPCLLITSLTQLRLLCAHRKLCTIVVCQSPGLQHSLLVLVLNNKEAVVAAIVLDDFSPFPLRVYEGRFTLGQFSVVWMVGALERLC